ncbi:ribosomal protein S4A [Sarracenia purpurea var. burkii]
MTSSPLHPGGVCKLVCGLGIWARGLKKHLKRLNDPKHWMLDKLRGAFAPKPSSGPHKSRECLPLILILRNRLKYGLTYREVISILMQRHVLVDGKVRTDKTYPAGFMDVVSIPKTNENFRLLYDTKGRFRLHSLRDEEAKGNGHALSCFSEEEESRSSFRNSVFKKMDISNAENGES